jgi:hypothetical protein
VCTEESMANAIAETNAEAHHACPSRLNHRPHGLPAKPARSADSASRMQASTLGAATRVTSTVRRLSARSGGSSLRIE